jgi:hypothetical protein
MGPDSAGFDLPSPAGTPPDTGMPRAAKVALGCGSGCVVLILLEGLAFWGMVTLYGSLRVPTGMVSKVQAPAAVAVGRPFPLTLTVRNDGDREFQVNTIVAQARTLGGVELSDPEPAPQSLNVMVGSRVWTYQHTVAPGQTWKVRFKAQVHSPGGHDGSIQLQVGFVPVPVRFSVPTSPNGAHHGDTESHGDDRPPSERGSPRQSADESR